MQEFHDGRMSSLMSVLTSVPRASQLLDKEPSHVLLVNSLEHEFKHYLQQVFRHTFQQDKRYNTRQVGEGNNERKNHIKAVFVCVSTETLISPFSIK